MIMLIFMSFNWWLMISVAVGAGLGHYVWGSRISGSSQSLACH
ncbi:unnamed protein product [Kuraishia capsulata CBS 1993]|uniref:Copper transport protein n=1 Tax=Kuraishia capsulata CBS 1993 TaxID=1382522 RepID=W6MJW2_9ASCO|nr:uncharacterized protein KUCA_T00000794001 [Kuraishia capsulata CBS 1993]CDK24827.1 unnamed protein product [Kuraishia capsulata CBS 1993]